MIAQIYPIVAAFAREKVALRIDRQLATLSGLSQDAARSSDGLPASFTGKGFRKRCFCKPWMPLSSVMSDRWR
jgi:predicted glycoside hydrolase/deacetylase ChbG (UPF0249 family)